MTRRRDALGNLMSGLSTGGARTGGVGSDVYVGKTEMVVPGVGRTGRKKITVDKTEKLADAIARAYTWSDAERKAFVARARALGYTDVTDLTSPNLWAMAVNGASEWYKNSNGQVKITPEEYLQWYAKSKKLGEAAGPSVSRNIVEYGAPQIRDWINTGLEAKFGRTFESLNEEERSALFKAVKDYSDKASVSITRKGPKGETITTTKPGATTVGIQEVVEETAMTIPSLISDKERQDRINFSKWLTQNAPGA